MSQPISVSVQMDAASFHDFAAFDLLRHHKAWHRPLVFTAILLVSAGFCLSQVGQKDGAALLTVVLAVAALGGPAASFWEFFHSLSLQIQKMALPRPLYRPPLDEEGDAGAMVGEQDKPEASRKYAWHDMHLAYRTPNAIYLYVQQNQAYLLNDSLDAAWSLLQASLPAERLHDMR